MQTFAALLALAAIAVADNAPYRPAPAYNEEPAAYQYQYAVADEYAGVNFGQNEARDGYATNGEYRVNLPDGRTQIVTYNVADAYSGYVADVRYEGEAKYEPYQPAPYKPAPYQPAPYKAAPAPYKPAPYKPAPAPYKAAPSYSLPLDSTHPLRALLQVFPLVFQTFAALLALAAIAVADNAPYRPAPAYNEEPAAYQYQYAVADEYAGVNFGQNEARDGYATNGEYRVNLPDGRTQIVTYNVADAYSGYVADVRYDGEAKYEPYQPAPYKPAPYQPAPYKAAPAPYKPAPYKPAPAPYKAAPSYSR
eukprot:maker-scaffold136_size321413-snap-gene-0.9 protein:Tk06255 transcript:maker-scaffold136_size321413-snap-gene-0.9-mRNA-1 annotation:"cuticle protein"